MPGTLDKRVEQMYLELVNRIDKSGRRIESRTDRPGIVKDPIDIYEHHLNEIINNVRGAKLYAPCTGCRKSVEAIKITTLGALTALAIFRAMSDENRSRADFSEGEIQKIKKLVEQKYKDF